MKKFLKVLLVFLLIFSWVFSAWPQIRFDRDPVSVTFPPEIQEVQAVTPPNVSGWAWSSTIGWISFSHRNCDADGDGLVGPGAPAGCLAVGTAIPVYGVYIETGGNMTGHAWSANIGWIDFDPVGPFPTGAGTVATSSRIDIDGTVCGGTGRFCGWARALAYGGGWDGWISMRGAISGHPDYGVWLDTAPTLNEFRGWAWGDDVVGWISFNDKEPAPAGPVDYQVTTTFEINIPPTATNLPPTADHCLAPQRYIFSWTFDDPGDTQSAYQVQIDRDINFTAPIDVDSGKELTPVPVHSFAPLHNFEWNTTYYWRVMVWDSHDVPSAWSTITSFTTPLHAPPVVDFSWSPIKPAVDETVYFTDTSVCFGLGGVTATCTAWSWDFNNDGVIDSIIQNPTTTFAVAGRYNVELTVTCPAGFSCTRGKTIDVAAGPPEWIEIPPIIWLREFWADAVDAVNGFRVRVIDFVNNLWG